MPGLQLTEPSTERLERSPLELVVCQVRHERNLAVGDAKRAPEVYNGLGGRGGKYPDFDEAAGDALNITGGPAGVATTTDQQRGWNCRSADGAWTVVLMPDFFALETRACTDWTDFSARLDELVRMVEAALEPSLEQRLGLRFIDRIKDPAVRSPGGWEGWIDDRLSVPSFTAPSARLSKQFSRCSSSTAATIWKCSYVTGACSKALPRSRFGTTSSITTVRDPGGERSPLTKSTTVPSACTCWRSRSSKRP